LDPVDIVDDSDFVTPLLTFKDRFFELFTNALLSSNEYNALRLAGVRGLHGMILLREFLSETEISYAVQYFVRIVLEDPDSELQ
jgi:DNA repair/transcription protein MET18/MMS19